MAHVDTTQPSGTPPGTCTCPRRSHNPGEPHQAPSPCCPFPGHHQGHLQVFLAYVTHQCCSAKPQQVQVPAYAQCHGFGVPLWREAPNY